jgi:drug/metabolite transporter (DMT)-like permease
VQLFNLSGNRLKITTPRYYFVFCAVLSSILSSIATLYKAQGVHILPPSLAAPVGILFGGLISFVYLAVRRNLPTLEQLRAVKVPLIKLALCRCVFSNMIFTYGLSLSSGVEAVFLTKMEPYLVIFWVWILDKIRPSSNHLLLLAVHVFGALMLSIGSEQSPGEIAWLGDLMIILGVVGAALSYRFAPQTTKILSPLQAASAAELIGGLITIPLIIPYLPLTLGEQELMGWFYVGLHSIFFYVFSISLLYASLGGIEGWLSSALRATGPVVAAPIAIIVLGESLTTIQILGGLLVITTSGLLSKERKPTASNIPTLTPQGAPRST